MVAASAAPTDFGYIDPLSILLLGLKLRTTFYSPKGSFP